MIKKCFIRIKKWCIYCLEGWVTCCTSIHTCGNNAEVDEVFCDWWLVQVCGIWSDAWEGNVVELQNLCIQIRLHQSLVLTQFFYFRHFSHVYSTHHVPSLLPTMSPLLHSSKCFSIFIKLFTTKKQLRKLVIRWFINNPNMNY